MKETLQTIEKGSVTSLTEEQPGPKGVGMAVALDWGLVIQFFLFPVLPLLLSKTGLLKQPEATPLRTVLIMLGLLLIPAILIAIFGEGVRRGWNWTRYAQIALNSLLCIAGIFVLISSLQGFLQGHFWPLVPVSILLIVSPLIVWRMSRPETASWFASVKSAEARQRHGGMWPIYIALWATIGATLQVLSVILK